MKYLIPYLCLIITMVNCSILGMYVAIEKETVIKIDTHNWIITAALGSFYFIYGMSFFRLNDKREKKIFTRQFLN